MTGLFTVPIPPLPAPEPLARKAAPDLPIDLVETAMHSTINSTPRKAKGFNRGVPDDFREAGDINKGLSGSFSEAGSIDLKKVR